MKIFPSLRLAAIAALGIFASACTSVTFKGQDLAFDFDAESDSVTLELEYLDVGSSEKDPARESEANAEGKPRFGKAHGFVRRLVRGEATLIAPISLGERSFEELAHDTHFDEDTRSFFRGISVVEARADLGAKGELNLYQKFLVPNLSSGLNLVNSKLREIALRLDPAAYDSSPDSIIWARSVVIFRADAGMGRDWILWTEAGLEVRVPICSGNSLVLLHYLLDESDDLAGEELKDVLLLLGQALRAAKDFRIEAEHLVLIFGDENGDLNFSFQGGFLDAEPDHREGFVQYLKDAGVVFPVIYSRER